MPGTQPVWNPRWRPVGLGAVEYIEDTALDAISELIRKGGKSLKLKQSTKKPAVELAEGVMETLVHVALKHDFYIGLSKTRNGSLSVTLMQDNEKERFYIERTEDAIELIGLLEDAGEVVP